MSVTERMTIILLLFVLFLGLISTGAGAKTDGVIFLDFPYYPDKDIATQNVKEWGIDAQIEEQLIKGGLQLDPDCSQLKMKFNLPFRPERAILNVVHQIKVPKDAETDETNVEYKVNGKYLKRGIETKSSTGMDDEYSHNSWQMSSLLTRGENTLTITVSNKHTRYSIRQLTIAYSSGRFRTSEVIFATTVENSAILEYKKAYKGNIPGLAFYFYTLQEHEFIGGGEIYLDRIYVLPSIGERLELPFNKPYVDGKLYLNYLGSNIMRHGFHSLSMVGALNKSITSMQGILVREGMKPIYAITLTNFAKEIFSTMGM